MSPIESMEKRLPWSFFGFLLGTISLSIAIGFFYLSKKDDITDVRFHVDDEFQLIEMKDKFPDIKVLYKEEDIIGSEKEIKIIRIRLVNGGQTILQTFYDQKLPFGLSFQKSKIIAISPISTSNGYLHENLFQDENPKEFEMGRLLLNKPIIEEGSQISFKVYLIQDKGLRTTQVTALGKISGLENIPVVPFDPSKHSESNSGRSTGEVIAIGLASGYGGLIGVLLTMVPIAIYIERKKERTKKKRCREFLEANDQITNEQRRIIESYAEGWRAYCLPTIRTLVKGDEALDISELILGRIQGKKRMFTFMAFDISRIRRMLPLRWDKSVFTVSDGKISLNEGNKELLLKFLREYKEIDEK